MIAVNFSMSKIYIIFKVDSFEGVQTHIQTHCYIYLSLETCCQMHIPEEYFIYNS